MEVAVHNTSGYIAKVSAVEDTNWYKHPPLNAELGKWTDQVWQTAAPGGGNGQYTLLDKNGNPAGTVAIHINGLA
ncbi:hypothetical protein [Streptomyces sp. NPDC085932]|uniref:hypothetical protein n=1 Tax=Streptomyces sp. NPDC085932 TaxID=3365741 RepID=UPI0037D796C7